jgi:integrase
MTKHNAKNERIKRKYLSYLTDAKRQSVASTDAVASALARFEAYTNYRDFAAFHYEQAVNFKKKLADEKAERSGKQLSKATLHSTLTHLKRFFQWLAFQPGYKSRLQYGDADYFNISEKDRRVAIARREQRVPTIEQINHVIASMANSSDVEKRNRALIAFTLLTGARDGAIASISLKHLDFAANRVFQDARDVKTKFSKTFTTYFFPVGVEIRAILEEYVTHLRDNRLWGNDDPLFPATQIEVGPSRQFQAVGLARRCWHNASPIRAIFRDAFQKAGLQYFNPHSFRNTLVQLGEKVCRTPEEFKAWSQNLGHEKALTTFLSYGEVPPQRQATLFKGFSEPDKQFNSSAEELAQALWRLGVRNSSIDEAQPTPNFQTHDLQELKQTSNQRGERETRSL